MTMTAPQQAGSEARDPILKLERVNLSFGGIKAVQDVSFDVRHSEIRAIIGPNGAGKSSVLNIINGFYKPQAGRIIFGGESLSRMHPYRAARGGIARTFQNIALFKGMTTLDNIMSGRLLKVSSTLFEQAFQLGRAPREELDQRRHVERILDFLEIEHIRHTPVGQLPYGLQKRVELGRALAMDPSLLLLDEPMAGMNLEEKQDMCRFILDVREEFGAAIALIEHDIGVVMDLSDRIAVLDYGKLIADGRPDQVRSDPRVIAAYLGAKR